MKRLLLIVVLCLSACSAPPPKGATVLTYGSPYSPGHPFSRADITWMKFIAERSQGTLVIKPFWAGAVLSSDHSMIEVRHGVVDIGLITPIYARGGAHVLRAQAGFYGGVKSYGDQLAAYDCVAHEFPDFSEETSGLEVLAVQGGNFPGVLTRDKPIRTLADFRGVRLRAPTELTPVLAALGADPVNMPMGEVYSSLAKGVIDGVVAPADTLQSLHFNEVAKYFTRVRFARGAYPSRAISSKTWARLTDEQRTILEEGRRVWEQAMETEITRAEATGAKFGADHGINFLDFDPGEQASLNQLYNDHGLAEAGKLQTREGDGAAIYKRFQDVIAGLNAGSSGCGQGRSPT